MKQGQNPFTWVVVPELECQLDIRVRVNGRMEQQTEGCCVCNDFVRSL